MRLFSHQSCKLSYHNNYKLTKDGNLPSIHQYHHELPYVHLHDMLHQNILLELDWQSLTPYNVYKLSNLHHCGMNHQHVNAYMLNKEQYNYKAQVQFNILLLLLEGIGEYVAYELPLSPLIKAWASL